MSKKQESAFDMIMKLNDVDQMFDMICASNYFAGRFNNNIPVDESRKVFKKIKELLSCPTK